MAWHIPKEKMNNIPLSQAEAEKRFLKHGLILVDNYINNRTRHRCIDKDGYKVMVTLDSLGRVKEYARFSPSANPDGFIYNSNKWLTVLDWFYTNKDSYKFLNVVCRCGGCGEVFNVRWNQIKSQTTRRCPKCAINTSNIANTVERYLDFLNIDYIKEYRFVDCKDKRCLPFDFYIPSYNCCIEVDGEQHYFENSQTKWRNGKNVGEQFEKIKLHDKIKTEYCKNNGINLIRIKYDVIRNNKFKEKINELLQG